MTRMSEIPPELLAEMTPAVRVYVEPLRYQVWELPVIEPIIIESQRHRLNCPGCGTTTCAALPAGVPTGQFGARLLAFTVFDCRVRDLFLAVSSTSALAWDISVRANVVRRFFCQTC